MAHLEISGAQTAWHLNLLLVITFLSLILAKDKDSLALVTELLGRIPRRITMCGKLSYQFFSNKCELLHVT
jgi:hypothetical protein